MPGSVFRLDGGNHGFAIPVQMKIQSRSRRSLTRFSIRRPPHKVLREKAGLDLSARPSLFLRLLLPVIPGLHNACIDARFFPEPMPLCHRPALKP